MGSFRPSMGARVIYEQLEFVLWRFGSCLEVKVHFLTGSKRDSKTTRRKTESDYQVI